MYSKPLPVDPSIAILIKPLPVLASIPLRVDHPFEKHAGPVLGVARAFVERLLDCEAGVEADAGVVRAG
jgi:hypothetical protein